MDPNAALAELRQLTHECLMNGEVSSPEEADRMAELFSGLDEWISKGGFLPSAWTVRS